MTPPIFNTTHITFGDQTIPFTINDSTLQTALFIHSLENLFREWMAKQDSLVYRLSTDPKTGDQMGEGLVRAFIDALNDPSSPIWSREIQKKLADLGSDIFAEALKKLDPANQLALDIVKIGTASAAVFGLFLLAWRTYEKSKESLLIMKKRQITWLTPFYDACSKQIDALWKKNEGKRIEIDPIFNEEISRKTKEFSSWIRNIHRNGGYFQNMILYGPGGVGKTMLCEKIARDANVNFIMMSGGDLPQYLNRRTAVSELNKLFQQINHSTLPTVLFIDEAESLCRDRKGQSQEMLELLNAFLHQTGAPSKKLILCLATNRIEDIDPAVLSRMDYQIHIGLPGMNERIRMLKAYLPKFFAPKDRAVFTEEKIQWAAESLEGASGRDLFKLLNKMDAKKAMTLKNTLTVEIVEQTIGDWISERTTLEHLRKEP